ncbi:MAG TPA: DEAD/DEAH box helicase [Myxococcota bacterium]|nr:DEAD/DEAH box helicase [Myxococcota bacterium]HRY94871.1 DEAD/DEAH box helicase [Myxococcota bacterium]HSA20930.1 DEAD/DEAH box helicase [Myxococcota bacterium]
MPDTQTVPGIAPDRPDAFDRAGLRPEIAAALRDMGYQELLEVQLASLEPLRAGRNLAIRSRTGTGKTAAFGIPLLERMALEGRTPRLLALAPTRELANQIAGELSAIGRHRGVRVVPMVGGAPVGEQRRALAEGCHAAVGTPGRLLDLLEQGALKLAGVEVVVLDEADEMLSMGFFEDVTRLLDACKARRQVVILSASLNELTEGLIKRYAPEVVRLDLSADSLSVDEIDNVYYRVGEDLPKHHYLLHALRAEKPSSAIVFVNTRSDCSLVATLMAREGMQAEMLSGELPQSERERVMAAIRAGQLRYLVATDIAARGIDISNLSHVINYSLPDEAPVYLHRVGRTGRVGRRGTAVSLVTGRHVRTLGTLEKRFNIRFEERHFPEASQMIAERSAALLDDLIQAAESAICDGHLEAARAVLAHSQAVQVVAYLLKRHADMLHDEHRAAANQPQRRAEGGGGGGGGGRGGGGRRGGPPRRRSGRR